MPNLSPKYRTPTLFVYIVMIAASFACFYWIVKTGQALPYSHPATGSLREKGTPEKINYLLHVLLALSAVIVTARAVGAIFKFLGQPPVIGEVVGGILLGPSFLGNWAPGISHLILPPSAVPFLGVISQLGIIFYMFVVGLELDLRVLKRSGHSALAISHASIIFPFLLGSGLALFLFKTLAPKGIPFLQFALFMGVSMSITAFPVLARILTDKGIQKSRIGTLALTCAAVDDITAWCLLAIIVSIINANIENAVMTLGFTILYIALMFIWIRPLVIRVVPWLEKFEQMTEGGIALFFIGLLLSALATELIGIHALFGAFLLGAITPHNTRIARDLTDRIRDLVQIIFLPAFFAFTGLRTKLGLLNTETDWWICGLIIVVASLGKFGGTFIASKLTGLDWKDSAALGVLMNTRGLVELIVLNLGLDLGVITPELFTMLVFMALVTTFMTSPLLIPLIKNQQT